MGGVCCKSKLAQVDEEPKERKTIVVEQSTEATGEASQPPTENNATVNEDPAESNAATNEDPAENGAELNEESATVEETIVSFTEDVEIIEERVKRSEKFRSDKGVNDVYKIGRTLGTGGFSVVKLATDRRTRKQYACKIMTFPDNEEDIDDSDNSRYDIYKEIEILCKMEHPNVLHMKEFFTQENKVYLITELLSGGELLDAVLERGNYSEADARYCFQQLVRGISYLHQNGIVHRDLKLENLMLATADDITEVKIVDFGLAKLLTAGQKRMATVCGTPQYVAPEIILRSEISRGYERSVDMWSAGVILFILLGGYPPFHDDNESLMFEHIKRGMFDFDDPVWENISISAKNLVKRLLTVNPDVRPSAEECLQHEWFSISPPDSPLATTTENLKQTYQRQFRKAVNVVLTINKMKRLAVSEGATREEISVA